MEWREQIEENPGIMGGKAVFKGTRLSVQFILERLSAGYTAEDLTREYPTFRTEMLPAAFAYAADMLDLQKIIFMDEQAG